jgi:lipopolysaccharide export system protein LptA
MLVVVMLAGLAPRAGEAQGLEHDDSQPIEISADSLEVEQDKQVATFAGNVDAVQGDLVLSARALRVYYEGKGGTVGLAAGSSSTISKIEASGDVLLSSPEETAEGDLGIYDVPAQLITLEGSVVLTRGDNVLHGERLELDLATGRSRMVGTTAVAGAEGGASPNGRVKALFTPKPKNDAEAGPAAERGETAAPTPSVPSARPE